VPNIIDTLKSEVLRLARKEAEGQIAKSRRITAKYRKEVAQLKRLLRQKERKLRHLTKNQPTTEDDPLAGMRYSARSVRSQRARLGLSVADYAKLLQVSPLTLHSWENGRSRPRKAQFERLISLRGISKADAMEKLGELDAATKRRR
jgi:DNA-binding transcriptional regulator YiaG